jgi:carbamoyl-phosphate synthase large subunit
MGGQTALNCALDLERYGVLEKHSVEMIGAKKEAINKALFDILCRLKFAQGQL